MFLQLYDNKNVYYSKKFDKFTLSFNERESMINRVLDGSTYPGQKLAPPSLCKKI